MPIEFSRAAEADLLEIFLRGLEEYGPVQADRYRAQLEAAFQALSGTPELARLRQEITPPVRVHPVQSHVIVYAIKDDGRSVFVLRVRHHRENWGEHPLSG
ncbi:MAG: type II toxin-antitoxin system RelE/ParE family toxin [Silicimonas sp.]|nr:type II toxin-antitoxin system RelE/ParE family toxin [Silicimonas sp.]